MEDPDQEIASAAAAFSDCKSTRPHQLVII